MAHTTVTTFDECDLVRFGVEEMLDADGDFAVVHERYADIVLVDPFLPTNRSARSAVKRISLAARLGTHVVAYTAAPSSRVRALTSGAGCSGVADKLWESQHLVRYLTEVLETPDIAELPFGPGNRKRRIVELLSRGDTNRAIAERVHVSQETVKRDIEQVMESEQLSNRAHVASWAAAHGLVNS